MKYIDEFIDGITMYRLLLYVLFAIIGAAMVFGAIGSLPYSPFAIAFSAGLFVAICYVVNYFFAKIYDAPTNWESSILTGLILALIVTPMASAKDVLFVAAASGLAMASKYILAIRNKHIFNPAAIAVVLTAFGPQESASWWVGSAVLAPFVIIGGLLIARKIRRGSMVTAFILAALASTAFFAVLGGHSAMTTLQTVLLHSSLFFLAFYMLTEPWTSPSTKSKRYIYAAIVGLLFAPSLHIGSVYSTPELALIIGNIAAFAMSPVVKTKLRVIRRHAIGKMAEDIELMPERSFSYKPGQYVEVTLPHDGADSRGLRRYFTLASSPTEKTLRFGIRYYDNGSSFKHVLLEADEGTPMSVGQLGGDFTLPGDATEKLAFLAGGIGITPFRSMIKYLSDNGDHRSVKLLYGERSTGDVAYSDVFEEARRKIGVETLYVIQSLSSLKSPHLRAGRIDADMIKRDIPDYLERVFYVSGPQPMVSSLKETLSHLGVPSHRIKVDYFFGYA